MRGGFSVGIQPFSRLSRPNAVSERPRVVGRVKMVRQQGREFFKPFWKELLEHFANTAVQGAAAFDQNGVVGRILNQRVAKDELRFLINFNRLN